MARTSRNGAPASAAAAAASATSAASASVDALDNLNLDDMFADDGDALFDGLDMDLGNMDDLAESSAAAAALARSSGGPAAGAGAGGMGGGASTAPLHLVEPPSPASASASESGGGTGRRRTTKRKIKSPMFYEDDDDDYVDEPAKKKKRGAGKMGAAAGAGAGAVTAAAAGAPKLLPLTKKRGGSTKGGAAAAAAMMATAGDGRKAKTGPAAAAGSIGGGAAAAAAAAAAGTTTKGKKGKRSLSMPPPAGRAGSVAAAGQFGGRQKKGGAAAAAMSSSFSIPSTTTPKGKGRAAPASPTASVASALSSASSELLPRGGPALSSQRPNAAASATLAQIHATHPGLKLSSFCGLLPSNTLFYPFMPALPPEPSFKHRKVFAMIDRIHTSFMSHVTSPTSTPGLPPAQDTEAIFQLMQDAFREEKPSGNEAAAIERHKSIGNAISALRRSIGVFEKGRLAGDLLAVGALLRRQYDFLAQNLSNMERWCHNHLPEAEYASVYRETKPSADADASRAPPSVLGTFKNPEIKVKVLCGNLKEPKAGVLLVALLPPRLLSPATPGAPAADAKPAAKLKKRKLAISPLTSSGSRTAATTAPAEVPPPRPAPTYAEMRPAKRRKGVSDLIAKTARELESKYSMRFDDQRTLVERQQNEARQLVDEDPVQGVHTLGMWRWLEKSGYFARISDADLRWRLDGGFAPEPWLEARRPPVPSRSTDAPAPAPRGSEDSMASRLELLLCDCTDDETDHSGGGDDDDDLGALYEYAEAGGTPEPPASGAFHSKLNALGLNSETFPLSPRTTACGNDPWDDELPVTNNTSTPANEIGDSGDEIGDVINSMIQDLRQLNHINNRRTAFVESMTIAHQLNESSGKKADDASVIARCQQLLRKSKEAKGKNGKLKTAKKDEYALPW